MRKHKPTAGMTATITCIASDACPDMRNVASVAFVLRGPVNPLTGLAENTLVGNATLGTATQAAVPATRAWLPSAGEAQKNGAYSLWALATLNDSHVVKIAHNPIDFTIVNDNEDVD